MKKNELKIFAEEIRKHSIIAMGSAGGGHVGGVLSIAELLAVLYGAEMDYDSADPQKEYRSRVVLSKGHCGPALYSALALKGFFPVEELSTLNQNGSNLPSHCNMFDTTGIDVSTGSLGQGGSIAAGMAMGLRLKGNNSKVFVVFGDGECDEGQVWEFALFAAQHKLNNLIGFIDYNHQQLDGYTDEICGLGDLRAKFTSFGWSAVTVDGHDVNAISQAVQAAKRSKDAPVMIVLDTVKGKGWSKTEGHTGIHHVKISPDETASAVKEIQQRIDNLVKEL